VPSEVLFAVYEARIRGALVSFGRVPNPLDASAR
jgi:hypothetical protein